jgi:hypothetical protein
VEREAMKSLSPKALRGIRDVLLDANLDDPDPEVSGFIAAIDSALSPRRGVAKKRQQKRAARKTKNIATAHIRAEVFARAENQCEAHLPGGRCRGPAAHLDHFWGRAKAPQTIFNCWALCVICDREKTHNRPDADFWVVSFSDHCQGHGYESEYRRCESKSLWLRTRAGPSKGATP